MVMQKPSKSMDMEGIVIILAVYGSLIHINSHAKNEENLPCGFRDRPIATVTATRFRLRLQRFCDVIGTSSRARDDVLARVMSQDVILSPVLTVSFS